MNGSGPDQVRWHGVFPVLLSPFAQDRSLILSELASEVEFCIAAGAHGIVYPGAVSEFFTLSEGEFRSAIETVLEAAGGQLPVIAGVSAPSTTVAIELTEIAERAGASGAMTMLPPINHLFAPDFEFAREHVRRVAAATGLPLIFQNARMGFPLSADDTLRIVEDVTAVRYVKEETAPNTHALSAMVKAVGDRVDGVFGGIGGVYLPSELARGAAGTMPSPMLVDVVVRAYGLYVDGAVDASRELIARLAPLSCYELLYNVSFLKEVLRRRGVISTNVTRAPAPRLDRIDFEEIDWLERLLPVPTPRV